MDHFGFDLIASFIVPTRGWAQLELFLWAAPLMFWGASFRVAPDTKEPWPIVLWGLFGARFIGGWGQALQRTALEFCNSR